METNHEKKRTAEGRHKKDECKLDGNARSMGIAPSSSEAHGDITLRVSGTVSEGTTLVTLRFTGGVLSQLVKELGDQLTYHQKQIEALTLELNQHHKKSENIRLRLQEYEDLLQEIEKCPQE